MAQIDPIHKYSQTSKGTERSWSTSSPPTTYDQEEYTPTHSKKSVITKVKEKAKKLKHSLSGNKNKKLHENDVHEENNTPSWGVTLEDEDDDEDDEDPEFLGAPMYESELAPDALKEAARQHPRADPVLSEKNIVPSPTKSDVIEHETTQKLPESPSKTITETVTEKLAPAYAVVSDATHAIASKFSSFSMSNTNIDNQESGHLGKTADQNAIPKSGYLGKTIEQNDIPKSGCLGEKNAIPKSGYWEKNAEQTAIPKSGHLEQNENFNSPHKWDKGVSVKEYFVEKFEPGEGERSLSQIITEAISPRQQASGDIGIMEKMKGAVSSFIRADDSAKSTENTTKSSTPNNSNINSSKYTKFSPKNSNLDSKNVIISTNDNLPQDNNPITMPHNKSYINESAASLSHLPEFHSASSSPLIPISSSIHEVAEEEQSHGRILQPN